MGGRRASELDHATDEERSVGRKPLGEYLVEDGAVTASQVQDALDRQRALAARGDPRRIGEILIEHGLIDIRQLQRALDRQWQEDLRVGGPRHGGSVL